VNAVWLRARAQLRGRAQATVLLLVLVGVAGGVVLAAVAGARRSDAALPRFLAASQTTDATVWFLTGPRGGQPAQSELAEELRAVAALPPGPRQSRGLHRMSEHAWRWNLAPGLDQRGRVAPDHDVRSSDK
jgi:hypothetical protein